MCFIFESNFREYAKTIFLQYENEEFRFNPSSGC